MTPRLHTRSGFSNPFAGRSGTRVYLGCVAVAAALAGLIQNGSPV